MNSAKLLFVLFLSLFYWYKKIYAINNFKFEKALLCPNNKRLPVTTLALKSFNIKEKVYVDSEVDVKEVITGPISVEYIQLFC